MPDDDVQSDKPSASTTNHTAGAAQQAPQKRTSISIFSIPAPIKRVFNQFPLITYAENELPLRAPTPKSREEHVLHVFTTARDAQDGRPSYNPNCLKWQTYLLFCGLRFRTVPSSNHASPSGALPFLLPAIPAQEPDERLSSESSPSTTRVQPSVGDAILSSKLKKWLASQQAKTTEAESDRVKVVGDTDMRYEAYLSLIESSVRKAWLHQLYLSPSNRFLLQRLYITPCSSNSLVQTYIRHQLREAAASELSKAGAGGTSKADLLQDAADAFSALSTLLGDSDWFFNASKPGLFDAAVFAYTHLILDESLEWGENGNGLRELLEKHDNLVHHRKRILELYF